MSALLATANPHHIKAAHRRRRRCATGHRVYANNNPYRFTDPDGRQSAADRFGDQFKRDAETGNMQVYEPFQTPAIVATAAMLVGPAVVALLPEAGAGATLATAGGTATTTTGGLMAASEAAGGHMLARHVGLSTGQLASRLATDTGIKAASTFTNAATAEASLSGALAANQGQVASWLAGNGARLTIQGVSESPVGSVLARGASQAVESPAARFVLQRASDMAEGFRVVTGFPVVP